jgi:hypothetical protein
MVNQKPRADMTREELIEKVEEQEKELEELADELKEEKYRGDDKQFQIEKLKN